jgi:geranylgeranyl reductase family protein
MVTCDVLIVGGGPAGSSCAWALGRAGIDVLVVDKSEFPRDKVCAGWITPHVLAELEIDPDEYGRSRTCQPITAFRIGRIGGREVRVDYGRPVSFGIRRRELDHYLLDRCGARLHLGQPVRTVQRSGTTWVVDDRFRAPMLVAAGGHFCPIARSLRSESEGRVPVVVAQAAEFPLDATEAAACRVEPEVPEVYFSRDLAGYGWCFRKGNFLNVGLGREDRRGLSDHVARLLDWLKRRGRIPEDVPSRLRGHAYYLHGHSPRQLVDHGMLAIGDAAGLAYAESGEGIRPAVESGLIAARVIAAAGGDYAPERLRPYEEQITARFGRGTTRAGAFRLVPAWVRQFLAARLLASRSFVRRVVLDRWFLHAHHPPLDEHNDPSPAQQKAAADR